jgi:hypothetical protein
MKKIFTLVIIMSFAFFAKSQTQISIGNSTNSEVFYDSKFTTDGGTINVGITKALGTSDDNCYIVKLNASKQVVWQRSIPNPGLDYLYKVKICANGDYIAIGRITVNNVGRGLVCRFNSTNGNLIWSSSSAITNSTNGDAFFDVEETASRNIAVVGATDYRGGTVNGIAILLNANGSQNWARFFDYSQSDIFLSIKQMTDGNLIIGGFYFASSSDNGLIIELNEANANVVSQNDYSLNLVNPNPLVTVGLNSMNYPECSIINGNVSFQFNLTNGCCDPRSSQGIYQYNQTSKALTGNIIHRIGFDNVGNKKFFAIGNNDFLISQSISGANNSNNTFVSRITNGISAYDRRIVGSGNILYGLNVSGNNLNAIGSSSNNGGDAYSMFSTINFPLSSSPCSINNADSLVITASIPTRTLNVIPLIALNGVSSITLTTDTNTGTVTNICGAVVSCPNDSSYTIKKCANQNVTLNARQGTTYSWSPATDLSASNIKSPICTTTSNTNYIVTIFNAATNCTYRDTITVTVNPAPFSNLRDTSICLGNSVQLNAPTGFTYSWSPNTNISNTTISNPVVSPLVTTDYILTLTNGFGCTFIDTVKVTVNPKPFSNIRDTSICLGNSVQLNAPTGFIYSWSPTTNISNTTISNPIVSPLVTTDYILTLTNGFGCTFIDTVKVTVNPKPFSNIKDTSLCIGDSIRLVAPVGFNYSWSPATYISNTSVASPLVWPPTTTNYILTLSNAFGCTYKDTVLVTVNDCHCEDSCSWSLTGNLNVKSKYFIGSINNADFKIRTNNTQRMVITAGGNIGLNTPTPTKTLDVNGEAIVRNLPAAAANDKLVLANATGELKSLAPGTTGQYLSGNGTWQTLPTGGGTVTAANQGLTLEGNTVQLGDYCGNGGGNFLRNREINLNNNNLYFNSSRLGKIFMGNAASCKDLVTRLEISSAGLKVKNAYSNVFGSTSGLRFTNLTANDRPIDNKYDGVLSLDEDGDVIWVSACCNQAGKNDQITSILERLEKLETELKAVKNENLTLKNKLNQTEVTLEYKTNVLEQNVPNPFTEATAIGYNIVSNFSKAEIIFSTMKGEIIKTVQLQHSGKGQINVSASFVSKGVYSYSLIIDGKLVETKKMIKE